VLVNDSCTHTGGLLFVPVVVAAAAAQAQAVRARLALSHRGVTARDAVVKHGGR